MNAWRGRSLAWGEILRRPGASRGARLLACSDRRAVAIEARRQRAKILIVMLGLYTIALGALHQFSDSVGVPGAGVALTDASLLMVQPCVLTLDEYGDQLAATPTYPTCMQRPGLATGQAKQFQTVSPVDPEGRR